MSRHLLLATCLWLLTVSSDTAGEEKKTDRVPVGVAQAQLLAAATRIELPGTVLAWAETSLGAEIDGRVQDILVREGQYVKKDTPVLQMRTVPLELERDLAEAEHKRVATVLEELQTGTRQEVIEAARFAKQQAEARLQLAEIELKRIDQLYKEGVVSLDEFDKHRTEAEAARAELQGKEEVLKEYVAGPRAERIRQEQANLEAAEARVRIIQDNIQRATIRAPFNGYIVKKGTEVGEWLEKGDPALTMIAAYPIKVEVNLPQFYFSQVGVGTPAKVTLEGYGASQKNQEFKGKVVEKVASGDPNSRTFPVRIRINTSGRKVAPGMLVRVELLPSAQAEKLLYVPKDALVRTPKDTAVWVVHPDKNKVMKAEKVPVTPGKEVNSLVAIAFEKNRIKTGDWVVVQGNERLKPDTAVEIVKRN